MELPAASSGSSSTFPRSVAPRLQRRRKRLWSKLKTEEKLSKGASTRKSYNWFSMRDGIEYFFQLKETGSRGPLLKAAAAMNIGGASLSRWLQNKDKIYDRAGLHDAAKLLGRKVRGCG